MIDHPVADWNLRLFAVRLGGAVPEKHRFTMSGSAWFSLVLVCGMIPFFRGTEVMRMLKKTATALAQGFASDEQAGARTPTEAERERDICLQNHIVQDV